jgi:hypothetical protein
MAHFEFYVGDCVRRLSWDQVEDRVLVGPKMIQVMEEQMKTLIQRIKEVLDR